MTINENNNIKDTSENTPTETANVRRERKTASGVVIRDVTKSGAGIGIVGGVLPVKTEKPN
jgi:hypothetical protein